MCVCVVCIRVSRRRRLFLFNSRSNKNSINKSFIDYIIVKLREKMLKMRERYLFLLENRILTAFFFSLVHALLTQSASLFMMIVISINIKIKRERVKGFGINFVIYKALNERRRRQVFFSLSIYYYFFI